MGNAELILSKNEQAIAAHLKKKGYQLKQIRYGKRADTLTYENNQVRCVLKLRVKIHDLNERTLPKFLSELR